MASYIKKESSFYVTALVPQTGQYLLHVVLNNNAIFSVKSLTNDINDINIDSVYIDQSIQRSFRREVAIGPRGYAFI